MTVLTIEQEIATWAASRLPWQQAVLRQLAAGKVFSEADIRAIAAALRAPQAAASAPLQAADIPQGGSSGVTVVLRAIGDTANINGLIPGQELTFGSVGLTVVYGDNGSGKSGYARIIKDAVGARHHEPVHPNVFADPVRGPQQAEIAYACDGAEQASAWPGSVAADLQAIAFYDEACGDAYVGGESELTYRPSALSILDGLISVCDAVRGALDADLNDNERARGQLPTVPPGSSAARLLANLSADTSPVQIDAACEVLDGAEQSVADLILEEARLRSTDPSKEQARLEALAGRIESLAKHVSAVATGLGDEKVSEALAARASAVELRAAATIASSATFDAEPVSGVGSTTWRTLWDAARRFSEAEAYNGRPFPLVTEDARCVLCHQELSDDAADRLRRFQEFMVDTTAVRATEAETLLARLTSLLSAVDPMPARIAALLAEIDGPDASLSKRVSNWLEAVGKRKAALLEALGADEAEEHLVPELSPAPLDELEQRVRALGEQEAGIDATTFGAALAGVVARKVELQGRLALGVGQAQVVDEIARLAQRRAIENAKRLTDTAPITRKTTELTEAHVTSLVRDRFVRESDRLHLDRIELKNLGGQKGKLRHRPSLLGARTPRPVGEVFSEGEQTALGLAGFFTEAYFDTSSSGLVLDDPVSSLDHIRRPLVARRLAQLAAQRQVIVFTHDIVFVGELRKAAEEEHADFAERSVQRRGDSTPGLCADHHPWKAKDVAARFNELEQDLARIRRERPNWNQETYEKECADWGGKLSETWERLINLEITNVVVDPSTSEVRPRMFKVLARITEDDDDEFQQSYSRCSAWARRHDKSPTVNFVPPEPDELETELALARDWFKRIRLYRN